MTSIASSGDSPSILIRSSGPRPAVDLREIARYGDLLLTLAERDVRVRYKQTALGVTWVVLQPLLTALIFAFVFGRVAGLPTGGQDPVLFAFAGVLAWNSFSGTVNRAGTSLLANAQMVSKIYFPRLILPVASVASALVDFLVGLAMMAVLLAVYRVWPGWPLLLLPAWMALLMLLGLGIGFIASSLMVQYRDVSHVLPVAMQMGLYASPVAYSTSHLTGKLRWLFLANPLTGLLDAFRWSLLGEGTLSAPALAYSAAVAVGVFWAGAVVFQQQERNFADVI